MVEGQEHQGTSGARAPHHRSPTWWKCIPQPNLCNRGTINKQLIRLTIITFNFPPQDSQDRYPGHSSGMQDHNIPSPIQNKSSDWIQQERIGKKGEFRYF